MLRTNTPLKSLAGAALAFALSAPVLYSQTQNTPASAVDFGMIGLAESQTLRLSIIAFPSGPTCIAQLGFANSSGGTVGTTKTVNLGPGQGDWLDLKGSTLALPFAGRAEVRPVVTLNPLVGGASACLANAEILDSFSGFSLVLAPGATVTVNPTPIFPLQGVAWGQVLRLNLVAFVPDPVNPSPCIAQLSFVDKLGHPAGPAPKMVNLSLGQADFLDVAGARLVAQFGQRAELRPVVTIVTTGAAAPAVCAATAEVYDQFSGRTWAWANPAPI
jgi:hypothetical protein